MYWVHTLPFKGFPRILQVLVLLKFRWSLPFPNASRTPPPLPTYIEHWYIMAPPRMINREAQLQDPVRHGRDGRNVCHSKPGWRWADIGWWAANGPLFVASTKASQFLTGFYFWFSNGLNSGPATPTSSKRGNYCKCVWIQCDTQASFPDRLYLIWVVTFSWSAPRVNPSP